MEKIITVDTYSSLGEVNVEFVYSDGIESEIEYLAKSVDVATLLRLVSKSSDDYVGTNAVYGKKQKKMLFSIWLRKKSDGVFRLVVNYFKVIE